LDNTIQNAHTHQPTAVEYFELLIFEKATNKNLNIKPEEEEDRALHSGKQERGKPEEIKQERIFLALAFWGVPERGSQGAQVLYSTMAMKKNQDRTGIPTKFGSMYTKYTFTPQEHREILIFHVFC